MNKIKINLFILSFLIMFVFTILIFVFSHPCIFLLFFIRLLTVKIHLSGLCFELLGLILFGRYWFSVSIHFWVLCLYAIFIILLLLWVCICLLVILF